MTAVSLNVGGGVRLIKPAKLYMCTQHYKHNEDGRTAQGVCGNGSVPFWRGTLNYFIHQVPVCTDLDIRDHFKHELGPA